MITSSDLFLQVAKLCAPDAKSVAYVEALEAKREQHRDFLADAHFDSLNSESIEVCSISGDPS